MHRRWLRRLLTAAAVSALLAMSGCTAFPDGVVARHADGYIARSHCPAGSLPQVVSVEVSLLAEDSNDDPTPVWAAHAKGKAVSEIRLFEDADDVEVTLDAVPELSPASEIDVEVVTLHALWGGGIFHWGDLEVGQVISINEGIIQEDALAAPNWTTSVRCDDRLSAIDVISIGLNLVFNWGPVVAAGTAFLVGAIFLLRRRRQA